MKKFFYLLLLVCFLMLSGCGHKIDLGPGYQNTSHHFLQALRWQDFQGAAAYLKTENRQSLLDNFNDQQDLHIVEADYRYSQLDKKRGTAESELILKYYLLPSTRVKSWSWKISWALIPASTEQRGLWQVQGAAPTFPN